MLCDIRIMFGTTNVPLKITKERMVDKYGEPKHTKDTRHNYTRSKSGQLSQNHWLAQNKNPTQMFFS